MTTFDVRYRLQGDEVRLYRAVLKLWLATARDRDKSMIEELISRTKDAQGRTVFELEERINSYRIVPLWALVETLLKELNASDTWRDYDVLQDVSIKLMQLEAGSTYR